MEITLYENGKVAAFWLSNAEKKDPALQQELKTAYESYRKRGITAVEYQSGSSEIRRDLLSLLIYNRDRSSEKPVRQ